MQDIVGFLASLFVTISFFPNDVKKIRILNLVGSVLFIIYGGAVGAFWTAIMNIVLVGVHIYYLYMDKKNGKIGD